MTKRLPAGYGFSTVLPTMDFETYSEAGYFWNSETQRWKSVLKAREGGLNAVGASVYSEHPSTEILSLAYDLKTGAGPRLWTPAAPPPLELFQHIADNKIFEAWNSAFEWYIWTNVCVARLGWPPLPYTQLRDAMAKARAFSIPGKLAKAGEALQLTEQKISDGKRLINKFSKPRNPTKKDDRLRITPQHDPVDAIRLYNYNVGDIQAESAISAVLPDLSPVESTLWLLDQRINFRGMAIDQDGVAACKSIVGQATDKYTKELAAITGGAVQGVGEIAKIIEWLRNSQGVIMPSLDKACVAERLEQTDVPAAGRRILEIRQILGAASVKKLFSIDLRLSKDGRLRDLLAFCGADRTGRWAGRGPQPQNLKNSGPPVLLCPCGRHYGSHVTVCPWCGMPGGKPVVWKIKAIEDALEVISTGNLALVEQVFGDPIGTVAGCLRGLFWAAPGHDLICSDYTAIEAVVLAVLSGEQWRIDAFQNHQDIYEVSASQITGIPLSEFTKYRIENGEAHPARKKIGKIAELASGYQGWVGAWKVFGADTHIGDDAAIEKAVIRWREGSPNIVNFWKGLQMNAIAAVQNPGACYQYRGLVYGVKNDVLYCQLPSGRKLCYHQPRISVGSRYGRPTTDLSYMGWNSIAEKGPVGWMRMDTYGGKLTENIVQAVARDILAHALVNVESAGYPVVLHVHDEIISEVPAGTGSIEEFEQIMGALPPWAKNWPVRAAGGWRGKRYRKE